MYGLVAVIRGMPSWKTVGPDSVPAGMLNSVTSNPSQFMRCFHGILVNVWNTGELPQ